MKCLCTKCLLSILLSHTLSLLKIAYKLIDGNPCENYKNGLFSDLGLNDEKRNPRFFISLLLLGKTKVSSKVL